MLKVLLQLYIFNVLMYVPESSFFSSPAVLFDFCKLQSQVTDRLSLLLSLFPRQCISAEEKNDWEVKEEKQQEIRSSIVERRNKTLGMEVSTSLGMLAPRRDGGLVSQGKNLVLAETTDQEPRGKVSEMLACLDMQTMSLSKWFFRAHLVLFSVAKS